MYFKVWHALAMTIAAWDPIVLPDKSRVQRDDGGSTEVAQAAIALLSATVTEERMFLLGFQ